MSGYDRAFDKALAEWLKETRQTLLEDIAHGVLEKDYWRTVGRIQALDDVKAAVKDIEKKLGVED